VGDFLFLRKPTVKQGGKKGAISGHPWSALKCSSK